jgi:hypothetical protein
MKMDLKRPNCNYVKGIQNARSCNQAKGHPLGERKVNHRSRDQAELQNIKHIEVHRSSGFLKFIEKSVIFG